MVDSGYSIAFYHNIVGPARVLDCCWHGLLQLEKTKIIARLAAHPGQEVGAAAGAGNLILICYQTIN